MSEIDEAAAAPDREAQPPLLTAGQQADQEAFMEACFVLNMPFPGLLSKEYGLFQLGLLRGRSLETPRPAAGEAKEKP